MQAPGRCDYIKIQNRRTLVGTAARTSILEAIQYK
jgi:hypothetical protein